MRGRKDKFGGLKWLESDYRWEKRYAANGRMPARVKRQAARKRRAHGHNIERAAMRGDLDG